MIDRHHNMDFDGGSPNLPEALNDRFWGQDLQRNFWYQLEQTGIAIKDTYGKNGLIIRNGSIVKGTGWDDINIPECIGYAEYDVTIQDEGETWAVPADAHTITLESIRVRTPSVNDFDISGATLDGATINYLKMAYAETNGRTRSKSHAAGTWTFERVKGVLITATSVAPTSKEVLLATFIGNGTSTLTITENPLLTVSTVQIEEVDGADITITDNDGITHVHLTPGASDRDVNLPTLADNLNRRLTIKKIGSGVGKVIADGEGTEEINDTLTWEITEENGSITIVAAVDGWHVENNVNSCVYEMTDTSNNSLTTSWVDYYNLSGLTAGTYEIFFVVTMGVNGSWARATIATAVDVEDDSKYSVGNYLPADLVIGTYSKTFIRTFTGATTLYLNAKKDAGSGSLYNSYMDGIIRARRIA